MPWGALAAAVLVLAGLQFSTPNLIGNDAYFHIRYAEVMREAGVRGFPPAFPWLPLTILAPDRYADHHMLYHVLLVPFTLVDLRLGGKLAGLAGAAAFVAAFVWLLRRQRVAALAFAVLALGASSADLVFRLNMTRVQALSLAFLLVGFHFALAHRHVALAVLACVYAWLYDGFPLLVLPVGATIVAELAVERRLRPGIALAALAGALVGMVVNPYHPEYLAFMWHHLGDKILPGEPLRIGSEWLPYDPASLLVNALAAMLYVAYGIAVMSERGFLRDRRALAALLVTLAFFVLMLRQKRFIEYFAPTATVFVVLAAGDVVARLGRARKVALAAVLAAVVAANCVGVGWELARRRHEMPYDRYAAAALHVAGAAPAGAMLCTTDWDDFPWLYFYNVESTYLVGLDPTYLRNRFRDAYWEWVDISMGRVSEPSQPLSTRFPCAYVMSDREHGAFLKHAANDPGLEAVLADEHMVLYRVRREGPPPVYPTTLE